MAGGDVCRLDASERAPGLNGCRSSSWGSAFQTVPSHVRFGTWLGRRVPGTAYRRRRRWQRRSEPVSHGGHGAHGGASQTKAPDLIRAPCTSCPPCEPWIGEAGRSLSGANPASPRQRAPALLECSSPLELWETGVAGASVIAEGPSLAGRVRESGAEAPHSKAPRAAPKQRARLPHLRSSISHLPRRRRRCHQSSLPPSRVRTLPVM